MLFLIIFPNESREDFCCGFPFSSSRKKLSRPNILPFRTKKTSRQTPVSSTARPMTSRSPLSVVAFWDSSSLLRLRRESLYWAAFSYSILSDASCIFFVSWRRSSVTFPSIRRSTSSTSFLYSLRGTFPVQGARQR